MKKQIWFFSTEEHYKSSFELSLTCFLLWNSHTHSEFGHMYHTHAWEQEYS